MLRLRCLALCAVLSGVWSNQASAQDHGSGGDLTREQLARVIAVLRLQPQAAGQSCLDALREVHKTEDEIKTLQTRAKDPDKDLAQDVLQTDYENGKEICGADADRVCSQPTGLSAGLQSACAALRHGSKDQ